MPLNEEKITVAFKLKEDYGLTWREIEKVMIKIYGEEKIPSHSTIYYNLKEKDKDDYLNKEISINLEEYLEEKESEPEKDENFGLDEEIDVDREEKKRENILEKLGKEDKLLILAWIVMIVLIFLVII